MQNIKSFADACTALNIDTTLPEFPALSERDQRAMEAHYQLVIIAKALNGDWVPDWEDSNQEKWYAYFKMYGGFSFYGVHVCYFNSSVVGSRLCFRSEEVAEYVGRTFEDLYRDYYVIA